MLATALAVRDEDARCAARAVPPASVARLLAARRDPAEWRSGAGRELSATVVKSEQARRVGRSLQDRAGRVSSRCNLSTSSDATVQVRRFAVRARH